MIYRVENLIENEINPITNSPYDNTWIAYCLTDSNACEMMVRSTSGSVYTEKVSKKYSNWEMSVCDFLQFHESRNKNIILSIKQDDLLKAKDILDPYNRNTPIDV